MYDITEKKRFKRIEKPNMIRFRIRPAGTWDMVAVNDLVAGGVFLIPATIWKWVRFWI